MPIKIRLLLFYLKYFTQATYGELTPVQLRKIHRKEEEKSIGLIDFNPLPMSKVWEEKAPMRDGVQIRLRCYRPTEQDNLPIIVFFHGGGFVTRTVEFYDRVCRRIAHTNSALVVSVDYRLAPEHKFPGPVEDCYDALLWISEQAGALGGDAQRIVVMGDSAGGNLATVVCVKSKELQGPKIRYQVLVYPSTDGRLCHPSIDQLAEGYLLTKEMMVWFLNHYKAADRDELNPLMSPLLTEDLSGLPPAFVITAQYDPLKDEGKAYAKKMMDAGVSVRFKEYKGMIHGFMSLPKITRKALKMHGDVHQALKEADLLD